MADGPALGERKTMSDLLDAIQRAGADDLQAVTERIADLEKELEGLRVIEKAIAAKLHGKPKRAPRRTPAKNSEADGAPPKSTIETQRDQVYELLTKVGGPLTQLELCRRLEIPRGSTTAVVSHDCFDKTPAGIRTAMAR
jgi:hypothetical protein